MAVEHWVSFSRRSKILWHHQLKRVDWRLDLFTCFCVCVCIYTYILPYLSALSVQIACNTLSPVKTEKRKDIVETKRNSIKWVAPIFTVISVLTGWKTWGIRTFGRLITQVTLFQTDKKALEASSIFLLAGIYPSPILKRRKWCNDEKSLIFESKYKKDWLGCADWYKALRSAENVRHKAEVRHGGFIFD